MMIGIRDIDYEAFMLIEEIDRDGLVRESFIRGRYMYLQSYFNYDPDIQKLRKRRGYGCLYYEVLGKLEYLRRKLGIPLDVN